MQKTGVINYELYTTKRVHAKISNFRGKGQCFTKNLIPADRCNVFFDASFIPAFNQKRSNDRQSFTDLFYTDYLDSFRSRNTAERNNVNMIDPVKFI
jgi:hypothetical protein